MNEFADVGALSMFECVTEGLDAASELLAKAPETAFTRDFRRRAETFRRTVQSWEAFPPTEQQLHAMLECVSELLAEVQHEAPGRSGVYPATGADTARHTAR